MTRFSWKALSHIALLALVTVASSGTANQPDKKRQAEAIVKKSISSLGGQRALEGLMKLYTRTKATIVGAELLLEQWTDGPARSKQVLVIEAGGDKVKIIRVTNGNTGWESFNDGEPKQTAEKEQSSNPEYAVQELTRLLFPIFQIDGVQLEFQGEIEIDGQPSDWVKVTARELPDVHLYFDKKTNVPVKYAFSGKNGAFAGKKVEQYFRDYRAFGDVKYAVKSTMTIDGKQFVADEVIELRQMKEFPADTFSRPQRASDAPKSGGVR